MSMVGFPLLLIPLAIYNIIVFLMPGVSLAEPLVTLPLMSGARVAADAERYAARARHRDVAARGDQGRASRREISHRSSAVADRFRRRGRRISAVAALCQLDLFPAGAVGAGGFPVRRCVARAARRAAAVVWTRRAARSGPRASSRTSGRASRHQPVETRPVPSSPAPSSPAPLKSCACRAEIHPSAKSPIPRDDGCARIRSAIRGT